MSRNARAQPTWSSSRPAPSSRPARAPPPQQDHDYEDGAEEDPGAWDGEEEEDPLAAEDYTDEFALPDGEDEVPPEEEEVLPEEEFWPEDEAAAEEEQPFAEDGEDQPPAEDEEFWVPPDDEEFQQQEEEEFFEDFPPEEEEQPEPAAEEEAAPAEEEETFTREGDLSLDEIPDDMREAVEGNLQLKRALSTGKATADDGPAFKKRKLDPNNPDRVTLDSDTAMQMLKRWRLDRDHCASYVLRQADPKDVEELNKARWAPNRGKKRSDAEQVYEALMHIYEKRIAPAGPLDLISAFGYQWPIKEDEDDALARLSHRALKYILKEYDGSSPLKEMMAEAEDPNGLASIEDLPVPDKKGLFVLGRTNCLELLDPFADALILGDANLTFSLALAEHRKSLGHSGGTVATTFEKIETLRERYPEIDKTIKELEEIGAETIHNVDCTRLAVDPRFLGMEGKYGAVYYNFPHAGVVQGYYDGHPFVRWRHANLMHLFFRALRNYVAPGGSVKVASNSRATGVRYSDIIQGAKNSEFIHVETLPFLEWKLSNYRRSYGDRRDSTKRPEDGQVYNDQRAYSDMVYCFVYKPSGQEVEKAKIHIPPTRDELYLSPKEGRLPGGVSARSRKVDEMYKLFLTYVEGTHVG